MNEAAERLIKITEEEENSMIEINQDGQKLAKVTVTVVGTWQKRGYSSKNGIVSGADPGEILSVAENEFLKMGVVLFGWVWSPIFGRSHLKEDVLQNDVNFQNENRKL